MSNVPQRCGFKHVTWKLEVNSCQKKERDILFLNRL